MDLPIDVAYNKISAFKLYLQETVTSLESAEDSEISSQSPLIIFNVENYTCGIVREICLSLIAGEYLSNIEINERLDGAEEEIKDFPRYANTLSYEIQKRVLESSNTINIIIENYKIFIKDVIDKYSEEQDFYLFTQNSHFEDIINGSDLSEDYQKFVNYFITLLGIVRLENFPTTHKEYIMEVFEYSSKISKIIINEYSDISLEIESKVNFLKHKWKKRIENINPYHSNYLEGGKLKTIEDFNGDNEILNNWVSIIDTQYDLISSNWKDIIEKRVALYKNKAFNTLTILQLHQLIKYYKDVKPNLSKLNEITLFIKGEADNLNNNENCFTKYAYNIIYNYAVNNVFSLYISKEQNVNLITQKYKEIRESIKGAVNNYFLRFKYLEYLVNYLQSKILNDEKINFLNAYSDLIEDCHEEMQQYGNDIEWAKLNFNFVFMLPYEECLVSCEIEGIETVFYPSTFVLPPSILKTERDYKVIKQKYDNLLLSYNTGKYFKNEIKKIEELGKNLDSKDFKAIEIISIFTAIITFVLSSIPAYKFIDSVWESLLFMLSLATALSVFVTLILFSTRDLYKKWYAYIPVIILIGITFFGYLNLTQFERQKLIVNKNLKQKIDSISIKKVDSIINDKENKGEIILSGGNHSKKKTR